MIVACPFCHCHCHLPENAKSHEPAKCGHCKRLFLVFQGEPIYVVTTQPTQLSTRETQQ